MCGLYYLVVPAHPYAYDAECKFLADKFDTVDFSQCQNYMKAHPDATGQEVVDYYDECHKQEEQRILQHSLEEDKNSTFESCLSEDFKSDKNLREPMREGRTG